MIQPVLGSVNEIEAGGSIDIPGRSAVVVVEVAGHSPGSVAYFFPEQNALFTGDALMTRDPMFDIDGPCTFSDNTKNDTSARQALALLEPFGGASLLPGHGHPLIGPGSVARAIEQVHKSK